MCVVLFAAFPLIFSISPGFIILPHISFLLLAICFSSVSVFLFQSCYMFVNCIFILFSWSFQRSLIFLYFYIFGVTDFCFQFYFLPSACFAFILPFLKVSIWGGSVFYWSETFSLGLGKHLMLCISLSVLL